MQLEDFYDYKNRLMEDLLTEEAIVELLDHDLPLNRSHELVYKRVFPFEYVPDTIEEAGTYICCDVDVSQSINKSLLKPVLYVWVFSHRSRLRLSAGGVLTDKLVCEIAKKINGSRLYGMGELDLYSVKRFAPTMDYQGKVMMFTAQEWNRPGQNNRPVPSNRKAGV